MASGFSYYYCYLFHSNQLISMKIPRVKDIKTKLSSARLMGTVVKNSLQFKLRRRALKRFKSADFDVIVVDMDGTVFESDANLEGLKTIYPNLTKSGLIEGEEIYDSIISKIASGQWSVEEAIVNGNQYLIDKKMNKKDFEKVLKKVKPGIRKPIIKALKKMKKQGKIIILATLSSKEFGELLNSYLKKEFGFEFDIVLGTKLKYDSKGNIVGVESIVGTKDYMIDNVRVKTKLTSIREALSSSYKKLELKKTVLLTDSYSDIDLAKMFVTILIKPENPTTAQKVSQRLKLADYILPDDSDLQQNLESIILGPQK